MQTALAVDFREKTAQKREIKDISVAISAHSVAVRSRIEALACGAGARIVAPGAGHEILLAAVEPSSDLAHLQELAQSAKTCAIWVSGEPSRNAVLRLLRAGVAGVVPLESTPEQLQAALRAIDAGLQVIHPEFMRAQDALSPDLFHAFSGEELTSREQQVLGMMAEGLSNKEISTRLGISAHTVKFHISSILGKLGAASRTEAVSIGVRTGRVVI